jgi:integrase
MGKRTLRLGSIYRRHGSQNWWVKYYIKGNPKPIRLSTGTDNFEEAQNFLVRKQSEKAVCLANLSAERVRMSDLFELLKQDYKANRRKSLYDLECKIESRLNPAFGKIPAKHFGTVHIRRYIVQRQSERAANASINRELAVVRRALHLGKESEPPLVYRVPKFAMLEEDNIREGTLSHDKYVALRDCLPVHLRVLFVVAYHVGCRKTELLKVLREHVDWKGQRIHMPGRNTKNKRAKYLPIYGDMKPYLEMWEAQTANEHPKCPFLFHCDGVPIESFRKAWDSACKRAGVTGLLFHDLRRTALTNMEHAGIPRSVAMAISGHLTESAYKRYLISNPKAIALAAEIMQEFLYGTPKIDQRAQSAGTVAPEKKIN